MEGKKIQLFQIDPRINNKHLWDRSDSILFNMVSELLWGLKWWWWWKNYWELFLFCYGKSNIYFIYILYFIYLFLINSWQRGTILQRNLDNIAHSKKAFYMFVEIMSKFSTYTLEHFNPGIDIFMPRSDLLGHLHIMIGQERVNEVCVIPIPLISYNFFFRQEFLYKLTSCQGQIIHTTRDSSIHPNNDSFPNREPNFVLEPRTIEFETKIFTAIWLVFINATISSIQWKKRRIRKPCTFQSLLKVNLKKTNLNIFDTNNI